MPPLQRERDKIQEAEGGEIFATVTMDADKTCTAAFGYPVGGIAVPVNKLGWWPFDYAQDRPRGWGWWRWFPSQLSRLRWSGGVESAEDHFIIPKCSQSKRFWRMVCQNLLF